MALDSIFAIVVGIEKYEAGEAANLPGPAHDAARFTEWLVAGGVPTPRIAVFVSPLEKVAFPSGVVTNEATRDRIGDALRKTLKERPEELFFFFWGGHGVMRADLSHRLFYADANDDDKKNLDLMDLLLTLRSTYYKKAALRQQIVIVDACATFAERMQWVFSLPTDEFPKGNPVSGREQFVLFATQPSEAALNLNAEKTGLFSRELLRILESDTRWPPDFKKIIEQLDDRFRDLYDHKQANQIPSYYWFRAGNAFVREFSIPELLLQKLVAKSSERVAANLKPGEVDFNSDIQVWAEQNGLDVEQIKTQLNQWVNQLERLRPDDVSKQALAEFYNKNFSRAGDLFNQAADQDAAMLKAIETQQARLEEEWRERKASVADKRRSAGHAFLQAYRFADALNSYEQALKEVSQKSNPALWAAIKDEIGIAHWRIAIQVAGQHSAKHVHQALDAYRQVLKVYTRKKFPQDWAMTQNNLALALGDQAARTEGAEAAKLLSEAVDAYGRALEVRTRERFPQDWAMTQNNLASALWRQAGRAEGPEAAKLLSEAVDAYSQALEVCTREHFPQQWAAIQNNLASALSDQAKLAKGGKAAMLLGQAVDAYREALKVYSREQFAQDWATIQNNLASALSDQAALVERAEAAKLLGQAVDAYREALKVYSREQVAQQWATIQNNLASALSDQAALVERAEAVVLLGQAVDAYRQALEVRTREQFAQQWATTQNNLAGALWKQAALAKGAKATKLLGRALDPCAVQESFRSRVVYRCAA